MLNRLVIRNFKRFEEEEIELGNPVVFVGPNNSGKTTVLQAIALWSLGLRSWRTKYEDQEISNSPPGATLNRRDLIAVPVPSAQLLWRNLQISTQFHREDGHPEIHPVRMDIVIEGTAKKAENPHLWSCGFEFDYANDESLYCRPVLGTAGDRLGGETNQPYPVPVEAAQMSVAYLQPMSGLAASETRLDRGAIDVRLGEGRTAEVLRNLCYQIWQENRDRWRKLCEQIDDLFGVQLDDPHYLEARGEITLSYRDRGSSVALDLSSSGRGLQQTLLVLSYLMANPNSVLLLDEPDAHLEILRQRQIYRLLSQTAVESGSQVIIASHSEVILNEAAGQAVIIACLGKLHRLNDRPSQLLKSLRDIGFEDYYQAEQTGWVLYLEGSTDLAILQSLAQKLNHPAQQVLQRPFVHYLGGNQPQKAKEHFYGLREAKPNLVGFALFDRLEGDREADGPLMIQCWRRREIENYLCQESTLLAWAAAETGPHPSGPIFNPLRQEIMAAVIQDISSALATLGKGSPWSADLKVSDDFLDPLFKAYYERLGLPNRLAKTNYHRLAEVISPAAIDAEVGEKLTVIATVAERAVGV